MSRIDGMVNISPKALFKTSDTQEVQLGAKVCLSDGRAYRYVKAGGTALVAGTLQQAPAQVTNHQDLTPTAAAAGVTSVTVTLGATAATANQYANGWIVITTSDGIGYQYEVKSHPAASASAAVVLTLADELQEALTASSRVDLVVNPYDGVIINPTTATSCILGVAVADIPASNFGWIQCGGVASVLNDTAGAITVGTEVSASNAVAGSIEAETGTQATVGVAVTGIAASQNGAVRLRIE